MDLFDLTVGVFATVVLFLYGLQSFSREIQVLGKDTLHRTLEKATTNRFRGFALGALFTAMVQSSSAVTALAVVLVDAGAITFVSSLGIIVGANVGTTVTAWLVSFKLTGIGPLFLVAGALITALPGPARVAGKSIFYFGLIFFALDLIADSLAPISSDPRIAEFLASIQTPIAGILVGAAVTALVQSSSVTTGLTILLVQQGSIDTESAVAIVMGANAGSTITALIASIPMKPAARRTALANMIINFSTVLLFFPFIGAIADSTRQLTSDAGIAVALAHLVFNVGGAALALPLISPLARMLRPAMPGAHESPR